MSVGQLVIFPRTERTIVPLLLEAILKLPVVATHRQLLKTSAQLLGNLQDWLEANSDYMGGLDFWNFLHFIDLIFLNTIPYLFSPFQYAPSTGSLRSSRSAMAPWPWPFRNAWSSSLNAAGKRWLISHHSSLQLFNTDSTTGSPQRVHGHIGRTAWPGWAGPKPRTGDGADGTSLAQRLTGLASQFVHWLFIAFFSFHPFDQRPHGSPTLCRTRTTLCQIGCSSWRGQKIKLSIHFFSDYIIGDFQINNRLANKDHGPASSSASSSLFEENKENSSDSWARLRTDPVLWLDRLSDVWRILKPWQQQLACKQVNPPTLSHFVLTRIIR